MTFTQQPLPYDFNALEPNIDARTMEIHYTKHHAAYVAKLNAAVEGTEWANMSIDDLMQNLDSIPESIRSAVQNNGGGHWNHSFFWNIMAPAGSESMSDAMSGAICESFGSVEACKDAFAAAAATRFGSGWAWLCVDNDGKMCICSSANQDNPLMPNGCGSTPLLGIDVWEHAYYLNYQNRRPDYVSSWWDIINWSAVESKWLKATTGSCGGSCSCSS